MELCEVFVFLEEHLPVGGDVESFAVGVCLSVALGQGLDRIGIAGLLRSRGISLFAGLCLGGFSSFDRFAELRLLSRGFGDICHCRKLCLLGSLQGCFAGRFLCRGFGRLDCRLACRNLGLCSLGRCFSGFRRFHEAGQFFFALFCAHVCNIHVFRFLTICGF